MKLHALAASAVTLALALSSPAKAGVNQDFIALSATGMMVILKCDGYGYVDGAVQKAADRMGADFDTYAPATMNAVFAIAEMDYDRTKLIPDVTRQVRSTLEELLVDLKKGERVFCKKYGDLMISIGWLRRK